MRKILYILILIYCGSINANDIYVSPQGSDCENNGEQSSPFKTLERAADEIKNQKSLYPNQDVTVYLADGVYNLNKTLLLNSKHGGYGDQDISFVGLDGQQPIIKCTRELNGWQKVDAADLPTDIAHLSGKVWVYHNDKIANKTWQFNMMYHNEVALQRSRKAMLYATPFESNTAPFTNITQEDIDNGDVITDPSQIATQGFKGENRFGKNELCAYLFYTDDNLKAWDNIQDIELFMRTRAEWMYEVRGLKEVDEVNKRAFFDVPTTFSTEFSVWRHSNKEATVEELPDFYAENALEFMTNEGDWCVNTTTGNVYLVSTEMPEDIEIPIATELIRVEGKVEGIRDVTSTVTNDNPVYNMHFKNICFEKTNRYRWQNKDCAIHVSYDLYDAPAAMLRFRGAKNCTVDECEFRNGGGSALRFDLYAQNNEVTNNYIHDIGRSGISFIGYPLGSKNVSMNNVISNNYVSNIGTIEYNAMGIAIVQSGFNQVVNNQVNGAPFMGIAVLGHWTWNLAEVEKNGGFTVPEWGMELGCNTLEKKSARSESSNGGDARDYMHSRYNEIKYNEVVDAAHSVGDCNGIYINTSGYNNELEYNFIHDIHSEHSGSGIRTDDAMMSTVMSHNIIYNCMGGVSTKNSGNVYENNYTVIDSLAHPEKFTGGIAILAQPDGATGIFIKTIKKNIIYTDIVTPTYGHYKTYHPLLWLRNDNDWADDLEITIKNQDDNAINHNVGYNAKEPTDAFPACMGSQSEIANPMFANPKVYDFTVTNSFLLIDHDIEQLNANEMGLTEGFPLRYRTEGQRIVNSTK